MTIEQRLRNAIHTYSECNEDGEYTNCIKCLKYSLYGNDDTISSTPQLCNVLAEFLEYNISNDEGLFIMNKSDFRTLLSKHFI